MSNLIRTHRFISPNISRVGVAPLIFSLVLFSTTRKSLFRHFWRQIDCVKLLSLINNQKTITKLQIILISVDRTHEMKYCCLWQAHCGVSCPRWFRPSQDSSHSQLCLLGCAITVILLYFILHVLFYMLRMRVLIGLETHARFVCSLIQIHKFIIVHTDK